LDGSASSDANGDSLSYNWSITSMPAGSTLTLSNAANVNPTLIPSVAGNYIISLTVNDGRINSNSSSVTITVAAPTIVGGIISANTTWTKTKSP
jgi:chitinase